MKKLTIFNCLNDIITYKKGNLNEHPEFKTVWSNYMINRFLSMDGRYFKELEELNIIQSILSSEEYYTLLIEYLPKKSYKMINYIKKSKKND